ncbi:MAG: polysaccharide deacetylase family protein [Rhodospirillaceae bacterium]
MRADLDGAVVLLYHGVTDAPSVGIENFSGKHMAADEFARQMAWIAANARPMRFAEMASRLAAGESLPPRSVAVTFDDSYANKADVALPILKRHGVPATFFITTGFVGTGRLFWTDKLEHCINATDAVEVSIDLDGDMRDFPLTEPAERIEAVNAIKGVMKSVPPATRDRILVDLHAATGVGADGVDVANYRQLDWDGVRALDDGVAYDVGGHSVSHEVLANLDARALDREIDGCLADLARELGHPVTLFSYPEGQQQHYNDQVIDALKARGVTVCPSAIAGVNRPGADPFHLRRVMVGFMGAPFPFPDYDAQGVENDPELQ